MTNDHQSALTLQIVWRLPVRGDKNGGIVQKIRPGFRVAVLLLVTATAAVVGLSNPAMAAFESSDWNLAGGNTWQQNAWECNLFVNACDWTASTKLLGNNPANAETITNRTELEAHGISASIVISKEPKATLTMKSRSLGEVTWTNTDSWIADNSGQMKPSVTTISLTTKSCGSGKVNSSITVSEKCVEVGL